MGRLGPGGSWKSTYTDFGLQKRDFFVDLKRQREKDKGREAAGPIWMHLAMQAKNLSNSFDLGDLLEAMKCFCSVRYEDYELYMRLLGEVPHFVKHAAADQLCQLIRLLARRRLRERNYVDMVAAHFLQKIRVTDDALPARLLVKTVNAFAALECRSQPKFVEHFLRHIEHRITEFDADVCCLVTPLCVASYMCDNLRRAYLKRCAETQAGFQGPNYELRNLACTEVALRKEHHSFLASVPAYVHRYLEKVRQHAQFDRWGSIALPPAVAPDGPKGAHQADMSASLQLKASTASGGQQGDIFGSDMHRDVSACLTHLGIQHENGVPCGPYLLDVVALDMVNPARRIVYEVNAPHHYYEATQVLTAEKRLRHRMLGRLGQNLHMVDAPAWRSLTAAQKMTYMLKLQQEQQDENTREAKQQAAANAMRSPLPALRSNASQKSEPFKLKSVRDYSAPLRVPVPPSKRKA
uniref:RAP domain-containing protein n=1 Tax=Zooxanthella nutricula TaxID=1333877 RepID=A0A7S2VSG5_9DINO